MEATFIKPRRAWLAALLSLLGGPLGQVYSGSFRRSIVLWFVGGLLFPMLVFSSISLPVGQLGCGLLVLCAIAFPSYLAVDAFLLARQDRDVPLKGYQRWWIYILLFLAFGAANNLVAQGIRSFIAEAFEVPGRAMSPTIQHGDRIIVDKLWSNSSRLRRNDVVVFRSNGPDSPLYVMRVVGLPGDEIELRNERLIVNGVEVNDQHGVFNGPLPTHIDIANHGPITIPNETFFVLGDNRRLSNDSRLLGPIPFSAFYGTACFIYWSRDYTFPDPNDVSYAIPGAVRWDRIGRRLD